MRDRITYLRIVVALADPDSLDESAPDFPRSTVSPSADEVVLEVRHVVHIKDAASPADLAEQVEPMFVSAGAGKGSDPETFRITLEPAGEETPAVYLHTASSPSRIVMDVRK